MAKSKSRKRRNQERRQAEKRAARKKASDYASESWLDRRQRRRTGGTFSILDAPKDYDAALASYGEVGPGGPDQDSSRFHRYDDGASLFVWPAPAEPDGTVAQFVIKIELGDYLYDGNVAAYLWPDGAILEGDNVPDDWLRYFTPAWWNRTPVFAESRFDGKATHTVHFIYEGEPLTRQEAEWIDAHISNDTSPLSAGQIIEAARAALQ